MGINEFEQEKILGKDENNKHSVLKKVGYSSLGTAVLSNLIIGIIFRKKIKNKFKKNKDKI